MSNNIQAQLNRLRASLDPNNIKPPTPTAFSAFPQQPAPANAYFSAPPANYLPPPPSDSLWCVAKRYGKYWLLLAVIAGVLYIYTKRRSALTAKKSQLPAPSFRMPEVQQQFSQPPPPIIRAPTQQQQAQQQQQQPLPVVDSNFTAL